MNKKCNSPMIVTIAGCLLTGIVTLGCIAIVDACDAVVSQFAGMRNDLSKYIAKTNSLEVETQSKVSYDELDKFALEMELQNTNLSLHAPKPHQYLKAAMRAKNEEE